MRRVYITEMLGLSSKESDILAILFLSGIVVWFAVVFVKSQTKDRRRKIYKWIGIVAGAVALVAAGLYVFTRAIPLSNANKMLAEGRYDRAIAIFEKIEMDDRAREARIARAEAALEEGAYDRAIGFFEDLDMNDRAREARQMKGEALVREGRLEAAAENLYRVADLPGTAQLMRENEELKELMFTEGASLIFDCWWRSYWEGKVEPCEWYVVERSEGKALLWARTLGSSSFDFGLPKRPWEESYIREVLNTTAYEAFGEDMKAAILPTAVQSEGIKEYKRNYEDEERITIETEDYLFLPGCEDVQKWLKAYPEMMGPTFWTRSCADDMNIYNVYAAVSTGGGAYRLEPERVDLEKYLMRPVMWVDVDMLIDAWAK